MASVSASARNPILPRLTPRTGISTLRASSAARNHQLAALRGAFVGVDDLDAGAEAAQNVRHLLQTAVDGLRSQHAQADAVLAERLLHPSGGLGGFVAAGVNHHQDGALGGHCGTSATALVTASASTSPTSGWSVLARSRRKYSTLPDGPGSGLAVTSTVCQPSSAARCATPSTDSARSPGSLTTPPGPTRLLPTSNCGFTMGTISATSDAHDTKAGNTVPSEMNDRSATTRSTGPPMASAVSSRTLVRSITSTRGSDRRGHANWP